MMQLVDWLDDLAVRFLVNLPTSELSSVPRLCFQVEEAQWYYEDFIRPLAAASGQQLPNLHLRQFCLLLFQHCPLTSDFTDAEYLAAYETFLAYKVRVPVRGAILLDESMERVVLVRGWKKGSNWSFPRGKINKDEKDLDCAIREVDEETGFNARLAGLVPEQEEHAKYIDITMREQHMRMFVFRNVPLDTHFEPKTRKEISKISWYNLRDLPGYTKKAKGAHHDPAHEALQANKFYMVAPFLGPLKKWIAQQRKHTGYAETHEMLTVADQGIEYDTDQGQNALPTQITNDTKSEELRRLLSIGGQQPFGLQGPPHASQPVMPATLQPNTLFQRLPPHMQNIASEYPHQSMNILQNRSATNTVTSPHSHQNVDYPWARSDPQIQRNEAQQPADTAALTHQPQSYSQAAIAAQFHQGPAQSGQLSTPLGQMYQNPLQSHWSAAPNVPAQVAQVQASHHSIHPANDEPSAMPAPPKASQLPAPNLNAHALKMLETLKQSGSASAQSSSGQQPSSNNAHQAKLLGLFKAPTPQPAQAELSPLPKQPPTMIPAQLQMNESQKPKPQQPRTAGAKQILPSMNEPVAQVPAPRQQKTAAHVTPPKHEPVAKQRHKMSNGEHNRNASATSSPRNHTAQKPVAKPAEIKILQRAQPEKKSAPIVNNGSSREHSSSPVIVEKAKQNIDSTQQPAFTILTRSGPAKETTGQSASPSTAFQPQVLKRQDGAPSSPLASSSTNTPTLTTAPQQHDKLLALFSKSPAISPATASIRSPVVQATQDNTISSNQQTPIAPDAPTLVPEQRPSRAVTPQNPLLDLFKKNAPSTVTSPETPISPFMLGSPNVARQPFPGIAGGQAPVARPERKGSGLETPTEAKGFLLGFLNDVVKREGK